jgi:long-chain acyl-CoA synthetase
MSDRSVDDHSTLVADADLDRRVHAAAIHVLDKRPDRLRPLFGSRFVTADGDRPQITRYRASASGDVDRLVEYAQGRIGTSIGGLDVTVSPPGVPGPEITGTAGSIAAVDRSCRGGPRGLRSSVHGTPRAGGDEMSVLTRGFAEDRGDTMALADDERTSTWSELDARVNRVIHAMRCAGLRAGDTISIVSGNRNEWFELALACSNSGITFVPVNWHLVGPEIAYIIEDSGSKAVMTGHRFVEEVARALDDDRASGVGLALVAGAETNGRLESFEDFVASGSADEPTDQSFGGPMFYTSGTTGNPKGVRSSLSSMEAGTTPEVWHLVGAGFAQMMTVPGVTVLCGPVYHSAQWAFSFLPMMAGSSTVMQHQYDSAGVLDLIDTHRATNIHLVPTQMKRLVDLPDDVKAGFDGSSLELVLHGAAPCPPVVKRALIDWWGPKISEYYGSTEGSVITLIDSEQWLAKGGSVGPAMPNMEIMVIDDDGNLLGPNQDGTLYFRNQMGTDFEYHNAPDKTAEAHREPGVFTTGDVGHLDDDGFLWLSDRKIDMIISGGVNIYPAEIEGVLGGHPLVADVAVIGVPNEEFGEEVKAVVVPNDAVDADDEFRSTLAAVCREQLAGYKCPRSFDFVDALPRTGTGKIRKRELREPYWEDAERQI